MTFSENTSNRENTAHFHPIELVVYSPILMGGSKLPRSQENRARLRRRHPKFQGSRQERLQRARRFTLSLGVDADSAWSSPLSVSRGLSSRLSCKTNRRQTESTDNVISTVKSWVPFDSVWSLTTGSPVHESNI